MKLPILYNKSSKGKIKVWQINVSGNTVTTTYGYQDGEMTTSNPVKFADYERAFKHAKTKWENKKKKGCMKLPTYPPNLPNCNCQPRRILPPLYMYSKQKKCVLS